MTVRMQVFFFVTSFWHFLLCRKNTLSFYLKKKNHLHALQTLTLNFPEDSGAHEFEKPVRVEARPVDRHRILRT